ncbi:MAG: type II secretion system F family protein [Candidatus Woesearchaeota archaeon]
MKLLYLEQFGKAFTPKRFRPSLHEYVQKAGMEDVPFRGIGLLFWVTAIITSIIYLTQIYINISSKGPFAFFVITFLAWAGIELGLFALGLLTGYTVLNLRIFKRTRMLEDRLSDYLILVSTNIKGGMSFENSLWAAIKPEFGILAKEITIVSKKVLTGTDVSTALKEFADKYDSPQLRRSMNLVIGELESGGKIVHVIDKVIENLKKTRQLKQEMAASTVTYMIFIASIVMFIAPGLFALSGQLLKIISGFSSRLGDTQATGLALPVSFKVSVLPADFQVFAILALLIISIFSGMLISIIERGHVKGGLRYVFLFAAVSMIMFFLFQTALSNVFAGFMPT